MATGGESNYQQSKILGIIDLNNIITLLEEIEFPESEWNKLGLKLHISQPKLNTVRANNPLDVQGCLRECLTQWLQQSYDVDKYGKPTLELLAAAVKGMGLRAVADKILRKTKPLEESVTRHTRIINSDIHNEFHKLRSKFAALVVKIRDHLADKVRHQKLKIVNIARFVEEFLHLNGIRLTDEVSVDILFNRIQGYYCYLNCSLIESIVEEHFEKSCMECITGRFMPHSTSDTCIRKEMKTYVKKMNHFKQSNSLKKLQSRIVKTYEIISSSDTTCIVVIKLHGGWDKKTISDLESLLRHYFTRSDVFNHLQITPGSICITYLVPRSAIAYITNAVKLKSKSMHRVGIFYFSINGNVLLDKKKYINFNESLIEAVKLDDTFEVLLLLSLGADPYYQDSNRDSPMMLALLSESKEVSQLFIKLVSDEEEELDKISCMDADKEEQMKIVMQKLQASKAEEKLKNKNARFLDNEKDQAGWKQLLERALLNSNTSIVTLSQDMNVITARLTVLLMLVASALNLFKSQHEMVLFICFLLIPGIMHLIIHRIWKNQICVRIMSCVAFFISGIICSMMVKGNLSIIPLVISSLPFFLYVSEIFSEKVTDIVSSVVLFIASTMNLSFEFSFSFRLFTLLANISSAYKQYYSVDQTYQKIAPYIIIFLKIFAYNVNFYKALSIFDKTYCLTSFFCFYFAACRIDSLPFVVSQFIIGFIILWLLNSYLSLFALFATLQLHLFLFLQFFNNTKFSQNDKYTLLFFSYVFSTYYICNHVIFLCMPVV